MERQLLWLNCKNAVCWPPVVWFKETMGWALQMQVQWTIIPYVYAHVICIAPLIKRQNPKETHSNHIHKLCLSLRQLLIWFHLVMFSVNDWCSFPLLWISTYAQHKSCMAIKPHLADATWKLPNTDWQRGWKSQHFPLTYWVWVDCIIKKEISASNCMKRIVSSASYLILILI